MNAAKSIAINLSNGSTNQGPVFEDCDHYKFVNVNEPLEFKVSANDHETDELVYEAIGLPAGATFVDRVFRWRPAESQAGLHKIGFSVTDGLSVDTIQVTVAVEVPENPVSPTPTATPTPTPTGSPQPAATPTVTPTPFPQPDTPAELKSLVETLQGLVKQLTFKGAERPGLVGQIQAILPLLEEACSGSVFTPLQQRRTSRVYRAVSKLLAANKRRFRSSKQRAMKRINRLIRML